MKSCQICDSEIKNGNFVICKECRSKLHKAICLNCHSEVFLKASHFATRKNRGTELCKKCSNTGDKNPRFGKKWTDEKKKIQSNLIKSKVDIEYRIKCATGKKGKKTPETVKNKKRKTEEEKKKNGYVRPPLTTESRIKCGIASSKRYTPEYKIHIRKIREENGTSIKLEERDDYLFYRDLSNWKIQPITPHTVGIEKLETKKLYSKTCRDKTALVRDHMYSRRKGFKEKVFPEIIRHPANCQLISQVENFNKGKSFKNEDCVILLEELMTRIVNWQIDYKEQDKCIKLIEKYNQGFRYNKIEYIKTFYD